MKIILKRLFIILLVSNSVLFSQWTKVDFLPWYGAIYDFNLEDSLNISAVFRRNYDDNGKSAIIRSSDGGRSWIYSQNIPLAWVSDAKVIDKDNIFVIKSATNTDSLLMTTDGGVSWRNISLPSRYSMLRSIQFLNADTAIAVGNYAGNSGGYGQLMKTTDGCMSWTELDSSVGIISGVKFINLDHGWVMGKELRETRDGGQTFTLIPKPEGFQTITSFDILHDTIIAIGGYRSVFVPPNTTRLFIQMAFSTDRGQTWRYHDYSQQNWEGSPEKMVFIDENTAIALLIKNQGIVMTTDQGVTWTKGNPPEMHYWYTDMKLFGRKLYAAGRGSSFLVSGNDITQPWDVRMDQFYEFPECAAFSKSGLCVIGANPGLLYFSTDRGNTWGKRSSPVDYPVGISIVTDSLIYLVDGNTVYRSLDKCNTIDPIAHIQSGRIRFIKVAPNGDIWLASGDSILVSSDQGAIWQTKLSVHNEFFDKIDVFEDGTCYAIGDKVFRSSNYGNSWLQLNMPFTYLRSVEFYDSKNGFILGFNGEFYRTYDGGLTLQPVIIPGIPDPFHIFCLDPFKFYLIKYKSLYSSYNSGLSWELNQFSPQLPKYPFAWMYMFDDFEGVGISFYDAGIWITNNRGNTPVELSGFSAVSLGNKVALQWTTETETNNMGFEIERKYKYGDWKKIAFSKGSGTSTRKIFYGYDDYEPKAPCILYYKQIDYNGEFEYSNEVEVLLGEVPENYSIQQNYPNPFNPSTKVTFSLPEENRVVIKVFNAMGEQVKEIDRGVLSHGYYEQDFEMGNESSGMYFCQVLCTNTISGRTKSLTVKMVLMK